MTDRLAHRVIGRIERLPTPALVAERAADLFGRHAQGAIGARGRFTVALSGGSTPRLFHEALAPRPVDWPRVLVFFSDERAVPAAHALSNYRMAAETLLSKVPIPAENVHRVDADDGDHIRAARAYEAAINGRLGPRPVLDLVYLGVGDDGHTASLFPGAALPNGDVVPAIAPPTSPIAHRVSFSYGLITRARAVAVLVAGAGKAEVLRAALEPDSDLPIARVLRARAEVEAEAGDGDGDGIETIILADEAACAALGNQAWGDDET